MQGRFLIKLVYSAELDPRIRYPSYKSLDEHIDVERRRSLDGYSKSV